MISRYNYMNESKVTDTDGETYPDPLSVPYNNTKFTVIPTTHVVTAGDIAKFWNYMYSKYNISYLDDILLSLNGIPYIGTLEPGDRIAEIDASDLNTFTQNKLMDVE